MLFSPRIGAKFILKKTYIISQKIFAEYGKRKSRFGNPDPVNIFTGFFEFFKSSIFIVFYTYLR